MPKALQEQVKRRAGFRCEHCQTSEWLNGIEGEIDHIIPLNHPLAVSARAVWVRAGYHLPARITV
jgi:hypothetical protein